MPSLAGSDSLHVGERNFYGHGIHNTGRLVTGWFEFHRDKNCGVRHESEVGSVFSRQMQRHCLLKVGKRLIQGSALSYDGDFKALRNIHRFASANHCLDGLLEFHEVKYSTPRSTVT